MKRKFILLLGSLLIYVFCFSQYVGVRAKYIETRLVDNPGHAQSRENRLVLFFYNVDLAWNYTPISLTDYDLYVYKSGLQYGNFNAGVQDSSGNNYPGYSYTAPMAVAYHNSYNPNYIDCDPNVATHYIANGHTLDCGFVTISYWEDDGSGNEVERFRAPNILLPYFFPGNPQFIYGNPNFYWPIPPGDPYNWYSISCTGSPQQIVVRGVLPYDTSGLSVLPVRFVNENAFVNNNCVTKLSWSNATESDINYYEIQRSANGSPFQTIALVFPTLNNGAQADYNYPDNISTLPGIFMYRIKANETSGHHYYSATVKVKGCQQSSVLSVYPNPVVTAQFTFKITDLPYGHYDVILMNDEGQLSKLMVLDHVGGPVNQYVDLHYVPSGIYVLIIRSRELLLSQRIVISN